MTGMRLFLSVMACAVAVPNALAYPVFQPKTHPAPSVELKIAAADQLTSALSELASAYEMKTGKRINLTFADSANLYSQIRKGTIFDAFFPSDTNQIRRLTASGVAMGLSVIEYAHDPLVLCLAPTVRVEFPREHPLDALKAKIIMHIALPDPHSTAAGRAALQAMQTAHAYGELERRKLVVGNDVAQTAQRVQDGDADLAFLPASAGCGAWGARVVPIPQNLYRPIAMAAAVITRSKQHQEAYAFLRFAASPSGAAILSRNGFSAKSLSARSH
jgi:molybdate transport system substrate-binding protein